MIVCRNNTIRKEDSVRALVIEDDRMIGAGMRRGLAEAGIAADWVRDGGTGLEALAVTAYNVVLLDLGLRGTQGLDVLAKMRGAKDPTPVLIVTARDGIDNRIAGLDMGADDYIVKPFDMDELTARIRAVLRRQGGRSNTQVECGEVTLDLAAHTASYRGATHTMPAREFALLQALTTRPGAILSRAQLEDSLYAWGDEVESNAIDVLIFYIRKKFDKDIIRNVRGVGWSVPRTSA
jgi:DNA-binding response OmpR family regulator